MITPAMTTLLPTPTSARVERFTSRDANSSPWKERNATAHANPMSRCFLRDRMEGQLSREGCSCGVCRDANYAWQDKTEGAGVGEFLHPGSSEIRPNKEETPRICGIRRPTGEQFLRGRLVRAELLHARQIGPGRTICLLSPGLGQSGQSSSLFRRGL